MNKMLPKFVSTPTDGQRRRAVSLCFVHKLISFVDSTSVAQWVNGKEITNFHRVNRNHYNLFPSFIIAHLIQVPAASFVETMFSVQNPI